MWKSKKMHWNIVLSNIKSMYEVWIFAASSPPANANLNPTQPSHWDPPRMKLSSCKLLWLACCLIGVSSLPTPKPSSVGEEDTKANQIQLSRTPRTLSSLTPAFLFEAVRGLANILQGLSSFLFTGTSVFGLLNLFKPGGSAGAGQLLGAALPGGLGAIQDIGGAGDGFAGILSPKSSQTS